MKAIDNSGAINYSTANKNILTAIVAFAVAGGKYTSTPSVAFSGGGGTGAAATAVITNGRLTGITITNGGSGYTTAPTISITGGGGSGATATATIAAGAVTGATVTLSGRNLVITDNTSYAAGDSRKAVQIVVADKFGNQKDFQIGNTPGNVTIDYAAAGLNDVDGLSVAATVISALGKIKNGSVHDVATIKSAGNLVMDI